MHSPAFVSYADAIATVTRMAEGVSASPLCNTPPAAHGFCTAVAPPRGERLRLNPHVKPPIGKFGIQAAVRARARG
jgi:hypothetical protein